MAEVREMKNPTSETQRRKREIIEKIREGLGKSKIIDWIKDTYSIKLKQALRLYREALIDLQEISESLDLTNLRTEYIERIESWIEKAVNSGDMKTAIKCQDMLNKMNSLYTEKQEITLTNEVIKFKFDS